MVVGGLSPVEAGQVRGREIDVKEAVIAQITRKPSSIYRLRQ